MKAEKIDIALIQNKFHAMKSKEDLLTLLNEMKAYVYGPQSIPFELKQLTYHSNPNVNPWRYRTFAIKKKSGGSREIHAPVKGLKSLQKTLNFILQCVFEPHTAATGFVQQKSVAYNARIHEHSNYVFNIDLKDFFSSIDQARVWKCFQNPPFFLNRDNNKIELANILSALCCTNMLVERKDNNDKWQEVRKNVLPQGAPTSPLLTNVVCQKLDLLLTGVAKRFGLKYSRYADDITFSSMHNVYNDDHPFLKELARIIESQNFHIKESKTRLQKRRYKQVVTGLVVNNQATVQRRYIKMLRSWLYLWETYGYEKAHNLFSNDYLKDKAEIGNGGFKMYNVIAGKLNYLKMVNGSDHPTYQKLKAKFDRLAQKDFLAPSSKNSATTADETNHIPVTTGIHSPKSVADFMSLFNFPNGLKYLTHDYDEVDKQFDIEEFLEQTKLVFRKATSPGAISIPQSLWSIVNQFAFDEKPSWGPSVKEGWSSSEWIAWSKTERKHPIRNPHFNSIISKFRELTRIETPRLKQICQTVINYSAESSQTSLNIDLDGCEKADFYTNVSSFETAFRAIIADIFKYAKNGDKVQIKYDRNPLGDYIERIITICHYNSFSERPHDEILTGINQGKGDLYEIAKRLSGYCNWSIETKWDNTPIRLNLLRENDQIAQAEILSEDEVIGFKHILTFYYK